MKLIYSKEIVSKRKVALTEATRALIARGITPKLAAVICSADPTVASYVSEKRSIPKRSAAASRSSTFPRQPHTPMLKGG
jgi:methylenetetrahydrofolate dehydrogenase (NADP+)/methenyltetrahydrofolate cyclohydrolase